MSDIQMNPFYSVRIGSTVDASTSRMGTSVIDEQCAITSLKTETDMRTFMTGESSYLYTDKLNQGSMGVSGSYGISGVGKISSAVSAYAGNSSANSDSSIKLNYNVQLLAGVEHINFDNLNAEALLTSLKTGPKQLALEALTKFNKVNAILNGGDLLAILRDEAKKNIVNTALQEWYEAVQDFFREYGDGVVVGVMWGGLGTVSLNIDNESQESNWKYGSRGNFSYSDIGMAVTVEAAYDGSQRKAMAGAKVSITATALGDCIAPQVKTWRESLEKLAVEKLDKLATAKPLESAPNVDSLKVAPSIPSFEKPSKEPSIASKFQEIKDLKGLEAFAIASAYDTAKKDPANKDLTLDNFIRQSKEKANTAAAAKLKADVQTNNVSVLSANAAPRSAMPQALKSRRQPITFVEAAPLSAQSRTATATVTNNNSSATNTFTVLGTWIANWSDLFPWLATAYLNEVEGLEVAQEMLKKQCMIQDMLALGKLYRMLDATGIKAADFGIRASFRQIADSFSQQVPFLKENLNNENSIEHSFSNLISEAQGIYRHWDNIKFLRSAELGMGVLNGENSITEDIVSQQVINKFTHVTYKAEHCSFTEGGGYSPFSTFLKLMPFITPNGDIYAFGPSNMLLKGAVTAGIVFSKNGTTALKLQADMEKKMLKNGSFKLYPIPFRAAQGISWKGQSLSTNIGSIKHLNQRLSEVNKELEKMNAYSFSSNNWNSKWTPETNYHINSIKTQYVGIIEAVKSVFKN